MEDVQPFAGRVAIVTGGARGLGRVHAYYLAMRGASVVVNDLDVTPDGRARASDGARDELVAVIRREGGAAIGNGDDVSTPEGARGLVSAARDEWGRVDIVVNNAGIAHNSPFAELDPADYLRMMSVHLNGSCFVTQAAWRQFLEQDYGRVVMTASQAGLYGMPYNVHYSGAKMATIGLARGLALEARDRNVRVNVLCPGALSRMMGVGVFDKDFARRMRTYMQPEKVAPIVGWLSDERCPVTGQIFNVRGGLVSWVFAGETLGYFDPELSMESIAAHFEEICDRTGYITPSTGTDATNNMLRHVGERQVWSADMFGGRDS
jgi:NAD(P)-dependent dehydrogenase (short-subunit alcohol dehydrogenase family)